MCEPQQQSCACLPGESAYEKAGLWARISFSWVAPLIKEGWYKLKFEANEARFLMPCREDAPQLSQEFEQSYAQVKVIPAVLAYECCSAGVAAGYHASLQLHPVATTCGLQLGTCGTALPWCGWPLHLFRAYFWQVLPAIMLSFFAVIPVGLKEWCDDNHSARCSACCSALGEGSLLIQYHSRHHASREPECAFSHNVPEDASKAMA